MPAALRALGQGEGRLIGDIIGRAFADDPVNLWVFGRPDIMPGAFRALAAHCYLKHGFGQVTTDGHAGTLWLPPGANKHLGLFGTLALLRVMLPRGGVTAVRRALVTGDFMDRHMPKTPHYYLFAIGVDPELQGKGVGGRLMRATLDRVDGEGMPAYLENSKIGNIPFYMGHGFRVLEEVTPAPGCPPIWRMWRDALS